MAVLYITEYAKGNQSGPGLVQAAMEPEITSQTVAIAGASAQSSALNANTSLIRLHTDSVCSVLVGTNPTATTSKRRMAAGSTEYFTVVPGSSMKVAVISNT